MSAISTNTPKVYEQDAQNNIPVLTETEIWLGSPVGLSSGYARALVAGDVFVGFADQHVINKAANDPNAGASGYLTVPVRQSGRVKLAISGAAVTDIGKRVYASDSGTFTFTATSNSFIGRVIRWVSTGIVIVKFEVAAGGGTTGTGAGGTGNTITDSTGGTPSTTFAAITAGGSYAQADIVAIKNALAQIALELNALNA